MAKRSQQSVPGAYTGAVSTDDGYKPNSHKQSIQWKNKGGRNATTNEARRGAGQVAPRPQASKQGLIASSSASAPVQAGMARVKNAPTGFAEFRLPVQSPKAGIKGARVGQKEAIAPGPGTNIAPKTKTPVTGNPVATSKPSRRGIGAAFYGEY